MEAATSIHGTLGFSGTEFKKLQIRVSCCEARQAYRPGMLYLWLRGKVKCTIDKTKRAVLNMKTLNPIALSILLSIELYRYSIDTALSILALIKLSLNLEGHFKCDVITELSCHYQRFSIQRRYLLNSSFSCNYKNMLIYNCMGRSLC